MKKFKTIIKWTTIISVLFGMCVFALGLLFINIKLQSLPPIDTTYLNTYGATKILDKDGNTIYEDTERIVQNTTYDELPELYKQGIVAVEDHDYWSSNGYSPKGMLVALTGKRGGSTIEQQLIKNTYYNGGRGVDTVTRKIHEVFLARQMNENLTKEEILTYYVNKLELGENAVGIKSAMGVYFNKTPEQMTGRDSETIAQLAYLTGLGQAPTTYDLYLSDDGLLRKDLILSIWKEEGVISSDEYESAKAFDLKASLAPRFHLTTNQRQTNRRYKAYTDQVLAEVRSLGYDISKTTLTIHTFLDQKLYSDIENTVLNGEYLDNEQQVGVAVINHDGIVVGMVGGRSAEGEWNRAIQNTRSSGSSMKPFTAYGPLLQYFGDKYSTRSLFDTSNYVYPGTSFVMRNYGGATHGMLDMQQSLRWSLNTPVARIDDQILGSYRMKTFLYGLGLDIQDTYSANDGIGLNVSPLQAAAAYNALDNGGIYTEPRFVSKVDFVDGTSKNVEPRRRRAMNESVAYVLTQMLRGVPEPSIGSAPAAQIKEFAGYAGKTGSVAFALGQNQNLKYGPGGSDVWYDSITNGGYSIAVWMGYDTPNTDPQIPDSFKGQQAIGRNLQRLLNEGRDVTNWNMPDNVTHLGGRDLSAHYKVNDSADIGNNYAPMIDLPLIPNIYDTKPQTIMNENWSKDIPSKEWAKYDLYKEQPDKFTDFDVLDDRTYKVLHGKEG